MPLSDRRSDSVPGNRGVPSLGRAHCARDSCSQFPSVILPRGWLCSMFFRSIFVISCLLPLPFIHSVVDPGMTRSKEKAIAVAASGFLLFVAYYGAYLP